VRQKRAWSLKDLIRAVIEKWGEGSAKGVRHIKEEMAVGGSILPQVLSVWIGEDRSSSSCSRIEGKNGASAISRLQEIVLLHSLGLNSIPGQDYQFMMTVEFLSKVVHYLKERWYWGGYDGEWSW
jgi:hypothetical protein